MKTEEPGKMTFNAIEQNHKKLSENSELSDHNKSVLDDFFRKMSSTDTGPTALKDYASRFNTLAPHINFPLDQAEKQDIEEIAAKLNTDEINKQNGEPYSDYSKDDFWKAVRVFYNKFIKKQGRGYEEDVDGPELVEAPDIQVDLSTSIDIDTRPTPEHVRKVAEKADNLRDRALIMFGWATGARIGELGKTADHHKHPEPIKWKDIRFKEKEMWVTLRGKSGERTNPIRVSSALMKQLQNQENPDLEDPVFQQKNQNNLCPRCSSSITCKDRNTAYRRREYSCTKCSWTGKARDAEKNRKPMTGNDMRKILQKLLSRAKNDEEVPKHITKKPHWFWRDGRALYWAAKDKKENFLRAFFGWSVNSDAPKHYIELMQESVLAGIREDYGEQLSQSERKFNDDSLKPLKCIGCGEWVSSLQANCGKCGEEVSEDLRYHNSSMPGEDIEESKKRELQEAIEEYVDEEGLLDKLSS